MIDKIGRIDIQAADGVCGHKHGRRRGDLAADQHLLHITAGKAADRGGGIGGNDTEVFDDALGQFPRGLTIEEGGAAAAVAA